MAAEPGRAPRRHRWRAKALAPAVHLGCLRALARWHAGMARGPAPGLSLALIGLRKVRLLVGL